MKPRSLQFLAFATALVSAGGLFAADAKAPAASPASTPAPVPAAPAAKAATTAPAPGSAPARATAASPLTPAASFESFRLISDRNIFNPNRTVRRAPAPEEVVPRIDVISLVGTMNSDRGLVAFFDGSDPALRKTLKTGESVGPFKVTRIASEGVEVEREGQATLLRVGQQLRKPEGGEWSVAGGVAGAIGSSRTPAATARPDPTAPPEIPADADEVTRRLMERRQKQLKN